MKFGLTIGFVVFLLTCIFPVGNFAQDKAKSVEVPFEFFRNQIIVQVKVLGKGPYNMLLDTGTDPSAIDLATSKEIGLKLGTKGFKSSGGGTRAKTTFLTKIPVIEIGALTAKDIEAGAIDLSRIGELLGVPVHGVLGHSFLKKRILQIDYPRRVVRFFEKSPFPKEKSDSNNSKLVFLSFNYEENVLIEDILVNGQMVMGSFDTGSSGTFQLSPNAVIELGLAEEASKGKVSRSVGYNGQFENREGKLKNVTIGGVSINEPDVTYFSKGTGHDKTRWGINIGNGFLKDFVVTIDYRKKTIALEKP